MTNKKPPVRFACPCRPSDIHLELTPEYIWAKGLFKECIQINTDANVVINIRGFIESADYSEKNLTKWGLKPLVDIIKCKDVLVACPGMKEVFIGEWDQTQKAWNSFFNLYWPQAGDDPDAPILPDPKPPKSTNFINIAEDRKRIMQDYYFQMLLVISIDFKKLNPIDKLSLYITEVKNKSLSISAHCLEIARYIFWKAKNFENPLSPQDMKSNDLEKLHTYKKYKLYQKNFHKLYKENRKRRPTHNEIKGAALNAAYDLLFIEISARHTEINELSPNGKIIESWCATQDQALAECIQLDWYTAEDGFISILHEEFDMPEWRIYWKTTENQILSIKEQINGRLNRFRKKDGSTDKEKLKQAYVVSEGNITTLEGQLANDFPSRKPMLN